MEVHENKIQILINEISQALGYQKPPVFIAPSEVAELGIASEHTLACWRSTGKRNLPFTKVSRCVKYRLADVAAYLVERTGTHTGEVKG
ncbi:hypothetical protein Q4485_14515 [Granulosicoccaceae sp. 1_MG-2023]|nr:hypothetical protein [Granulosicoccaceae sp. 1_MG-2023]